MREKAGKVKTRPEYPRLRVTAAVQSAPQTHHSTEGDGEWLDGGFILVLLIFHVALFKLSKTLNILKRSGAL